MKHCTDCKHHFHRIGWSMCGNPEARDIVGHPQLCEVVRMIGICRPEGNLFSPKPEPKLKKIDEKTAILWVMTAVALIECAIIVIWL